MISYALSPRSLKNPGTKKPGTRNHSSKSAGFTLLELAIVLFVLVLVLGSLLTPLATRMEQQGRKTTRLMLAEIRASLLGYTIMNGYLPCPDCPNSNISGCAGLATEAIGDGMEDGLDESGQPTKARNQFATCASERGFLPWATLGAPRHDAWGQHFAYSVTNEFADSTDGETGSTCTEATATAGISFCLTSGKDGDMTIEDTEGTTIAQNIPALVFSFGANGALTQARADDGSISDAEKKNWWTERGRTFITDDYIAKEGEEYDDIMLWIATPSLVYRMISAERLP